MARITNQVDELFGRILKMVRNGQPPSLEDFVQLEQLFWEYREYLGSRNFAKALGLRSRVDAKKVDAQKIAGKKIAADDMQQFINHLVKQKLPGDCLTQRISDAIELYIAKQITISKLFGERPRKKFPWTNEDRMGWLAEWVHRTIKRVNAEPLNLTDLYALLCDAVSEENKDYLIELYVLDSNTDINKLQKKVKELKDSINPDARCKDLDSEVAWRDAHRVFKLHI